MIFFLLQSNQKIEAKKTEKELKRKIKENVDNMVNIVAEKDALLKERRNLESTLLKIEDEVQPEALMNSKEK